MSFIAANLENILSLMGKLTAEQAPLWGSMNAQVMVEHLTDTIYLSVGKMKLKLEITEEKIPDMQAYLASEKPMPVGFKPPFVPEKIVHRNEELDLAIDEFTLAWLDFEAYYEEAPERQESHPYYGPLNYEQWLRLHAKHCTHHFKQFGLVS